MGAGALRLGLGTLAVGLLAATAALARRRLRGTAKPKLVPLAVAAAIVAVGAGGFLAGNRIQWKRPNALNAAAGPSTQAGRTEPGWKRHCEAAHRQYGGASPLDCSIEVKDLDNGDQIVVMFMDY
jgi:hypothetical protein